MSGEDALDQRPTVLLVDDAPENIRLLSAMLKSRYRVRAATSGSNASAASMSCCASDSASARERAPSSLVRSSVATPLARKPASTPRRSASHSIVPSVGRVLPRSIWETYSFEKRLPARSLCVRPAATRSCRTRSPRRSPCETALRLRLEAARIDIVSAVEVNSMLHQSARCP